MSQQPPRDESTPKDESEVVIDFAAIPYSSLDTLFGLAGQTKDIAVKFTDDAGTEKYEKVQIRSLTYGQLSDAGKIGQKDMKQYRYAIIILGLVNPNITTEQEALKLPYGFVMDLSREIEDFSGKSAEIQKK